VSEEKDRLKQLQELGEVSCSVAQLLSCSVAQSLSCSVKLQSFRSL